MGKDFGGVKEEGEIDQRAQFGRKKLWGMIWVGTEEKLGWIY